MNGVGRGGSGRLRNFKAMNDAKLALVYWQVVEESDDAEAREALDAEMKARGLDHLGEVEGLDYDEGDLS